MTAQTTITAVEAIALNCAIKLRRAEIAHDEAYLAEGGPTDTGLYAAQKAFAEAVDALERERGGKA